MAKKAKDKDDEAGPIPLPEVPEPGQNQDQEQAEALPPLPEPKAWQEEPPSQGQKRAKGKVQVPTAGRLIQYVTDERVVCPAIVTRVYKAKENERDVVAMHVNALDPVYGSRTYQIPDAEAAHVDALLSNELRTVEEIDKDSEVLQPGTWTWPARE